MTIELIAQHFDQQEVRFVKHPEGKYDFGVAATDLATVLEAESDGSRLARSVDDEWKGLLNVETPGGTQSVTVIWEPGVYQLLAVSRKPKAKPFQKWLFEIVLPSIRKTGGYQIQPLSQAEVVLQSAQVLVDHEKRLTEHSMKLAIIEQRFAKVDEELKQLPPATEEVPEKSIRSCLNEVIRSYAYRTGESYQNLWRNLYKEYRYRHHVDLVARAKNQGKTVCEYAEEVGVIDKLYAIALTMYNEAELIGV